MDMTARTRSEATTMSRRRSQRISAATTGLFTSIAILLAPHSCFAAFGVASSGGYYTVDTGAGLTFMINQSDADMTSLKYNGVELQTQGYWSHVESGMGSGATVTATTSGNYVIVTETATNWYGSGTIHHYLVAQKGFNNIYMATYVNSLGGGELRWIQTLNRSLLPNIYTPCDYNGGTVIESQDIFKMSDGTTRSKYYSNQRAIDMTVMGVTGSGMGVFMAYGNRESDAGGPFFRDIMQMGSSDAVVYNYMWSAHNQTENQRLDVLYGPYALMVTNGSTPSVPDMSFMYNLGLTGAVGNSGRGYVQGKASGVPSGYQAVVGFANTTAQYWCKPDPSTNNFSSPMMKPGTYTMTLYQGELAVATRSVSVTAGQATTGANITSAFTQPATLWQIGSWDGTPSGFLNASRMTWMHPSDPRQSSWGPVTYTIGSSSPGQFPAVQFRAANTPTTINFNLTSSQIANHTLRIGITCAYAGGRPVITVNNWTSSTPGASSQPSSRSITIGTYRGNNATFSYSIPTSAFVAGTNTLKINVASGSSDLSTWLSAGWAYDCVELDN